MKEPINPVTLRGYHDKAQPRNISIGRLWVGADCNPDGATRFNPKNLKGSWEKTMQFVVWEDPQLPIGFMVISDEDEFIKKAQAVMAGEEVELRGGAFRGGEQNRVLKMFQAEDSGQKVVGFRMEDADPGQLMGLLFVKLETFIGGMGHLFPKGEMGI